MMARNKGNMQKCRDPPSQLQICNQFRLTYVTDSVLRH